MTTLTIPTLDHAKHFGGYLAEPGSTPKAAIVVIQEIFGVNTGIRRKCDALAAAGYLAIAPDLFWRIEPSIELDPDVPEAGQLRAWCVAIRPRTRLMSHHIGLRDDPGGCNR